MNAKAEQDEDPLSRSAAVARPRGPGAALHTDAETPGWVFFAANAGWGGSTAHMLVLLPFLLRREGLSVDAIAALMAPTFLPLSLQFLWTPVLDLGPRRRSFFLWSTVIAALLTLLSFRLLQDGHYGLMVASLMAVNTLYTVANASLSLLVATTVPPARQGRAFALQCTAGMAMQGLVGTVLLAFTDPPAALSRLGRAVGLFDRALSPMQQGGLLAALLFLSGLCGLLIPETRTLRGLLGSAGADRGALGPRLRSHLRRTLSQVAEETRRVFGSRLGLLGLLTCVAPVSTAAASNLFGAVAKDFGAGAGVVSLTTGFGAALAMAGGSLFGGWLSDRGQRRNVYLSSGVALAAVAVCMGLLPATPTTFAVCGLAYAVITGVSYATFYPFVVQLIGVGPGMGIRYSICTSAANLAIYYVTILDGVGYRHGGHQGLLGWDAALNLGGVVFILWMSSVLLRAQRPAGLIADPASVVQ
jgi:hypothetical protein